MHTAIITRAADGTPSGLSAVVSVGLVGGVIGKLTQIASPDAVVIPKTMVEKLAVEAVGPVLGAVVQRKVDTGAWGIPFIKPAQ